MKIHGEIITKQKDMKELKRNNIIFYLFFSLLILQNCSIHSAFRNDNYYLKGKSYCENCINNYIGKDTVYLKNNIICLFKDKELSSAGRIKNNRRIGDWYLFKKHPNLLECYQVIRYQCNDSIVLWNRGLINESW